MIVAWAFDYIGLPYKEGSWGPDEFDCWGLLAHVYKNEFKIDLLEHMLAYDGVKDKVSRMSEHIGEWTPVEIPVAGDGVLFLVQGRMPHCGIYVGDGTVLHSVDGIASCIQKIDVPKWKSRFEGYYRYIGPRSS